MTSHIFLDMDGTLCKSRQNATEEMMYELEQISRSRYLYIVSGAELLRMELQVPLNNVIYFSQNGNEIYDDKKILWKNEMINKKEILEHIEILKNNYPNAEIEDRGVSIVVSFTGFHAPQDIKDKFDPDRKIRMEMLRKFPHPNAYVAGLTGIDFIPKTKGENIKRYIEEYDINPTDCLYIGDALEKGANDETVVGIIPTFAVRNPEETLQFLKQI